MLLVRRLVNDAVNHRNLDVLDEAAEGEIVRAARRWIGPCRESFSDFRTEIVDLIAEGDKVAAHFRPGLRPRRPHARLCLTPSRLKIVKPECAAAGHPPVKRTGSSAYPAEPGRDPERRATRGEPAANLIM